MKDSTATWLFGLAWSIFSIVILAYCITHPGYDPELTVALCAALLGQLNFHRAEYKRDQGR